MFGLQFQIQQKNWTTIFWIGWTNLRKQWGLICDLPASICLWKFCSNDIFFWWFSPSGSLMSELNQINLNLYRWYSALCMVLDKFAFGVRSSKWLSITTQAKISFSNPKNLRQPIITDQALTPYFLHALGEPIKLHAHDPLAHLALATLNH